MHTMDIIIDILRWYYKRKERKQRAAGKKVGITFDQYLLIYAVCGIILTSVAGILYLKYFNI